MIIFGAGSSVPFDIPGMMGFTEAFKHSIKNDTEISVFVEGIEDAISQTGDIIGISLSFDLETLLSVLTDLSGATNEKPISIPTASLLLKQGLKINEARKKYQDKASSTLKELRDYVFKKCMRPIKEGKKEGSFQFLDKFYGPLMTVLNKTDLKNIQPSIISIYSTNWDLCFKTWADYVNIPINDGTDLDSQSFPVLNVGKFERTSNGFNYAPLHGSLDLIKIDRPKGGGAYKDIFKISDPVRYFEDKPDNIKDVFTIYPLEAIGYEESIKSPYLDMLHNFRRSLESEGIIFVIGYSLRDPTIGSLFEEVIAKRIRSGDILPSSLDIDDRKIKARTDRLKIIVIDSNPKKLEENLKKQSRPNLLSTFIPITVEFPKITDPDFDEKTTNAMAKIIADLKELDYLQESHINEIRGVLSNRYGIFVDERTRALLKEKS